MIFYHIGMFNNYNLIVNEQLEKIRTHLPDEMIVCIAVGPSNELINLKKLIEHVTYGGGNTVYEWVTLLAIWNYAQYNNDDILYIHSKGVTNLGDEYFYNVQDWRRCLEHFLIVEASNCKLLLESCDTCGPLYYTNHHHGPHYSGNMWWTKAAWVRNLPPPLPPDKTKVESEFWITKSPGRHISLTDCPFNTVSYFNPLPPSMYDSIRNQALHVTY